MSPTIEEEANNWSLACQVTPVTAPKWDLYFESRDFFFKSQIFIKESVPPLASRRLDEVIEMELIPPEFY
jgi:hypothetical protein